MKTRGIYHLPEDATYGEIKTPVGTLTAFVSSKGLHCILWESDRAMTDCATIIAGLQKDESSEIFLSTKIQLQEYFAGERYKFELPLVLSGSEFQLKAWQVLSKVPYGITVSYGAQAEEIGDKKFARAIGAANRNNPISIILPCHRVVGANGCLVGFGGGLKLKEKLIAFEKENYMKNLALI